MQIHRRLTFRGTDGDTAYTDWWHATRSCLHFGFVYDKCDDGAQFNEDASASGILGDVISTNPENFNHVPGGGNILYMDGHCEFLRYPNAKATVTRAFALAASGLS